MIGPNESKNGAGISLQIERLILEGFNLTSHEQSLFRAALETELTKRLAAGEIPHELHHGGTVPSLPFASLHISPAFTPRALGEQVGAAVIGALTR